MAGIHHKALIRRVVRGRNLGVVFLDAAATEIIAPVAAHASLATPSRAPRGIVVLLAADADAEKHCGDEDGGPRAPSEAEGVGPDARAAPHRVELVAHPDEGGRHQSRGDGVDEERDQRREAGDGGTQTPAAGDEAREEGDDGEEDGEQVKHPAEAP